jgi:phosphatidylinositol glycan class V
MFAILTLSGLWGLRQMISQGPQGTKSDNKEKKPLPAGTSGISIVRTMAVAQLLLVATTLITAHVQIITRISSAYPVWLWYLAGSLQERRNIGIFVKFMVLYSIVQAGLYASFLPPA